MPTSSPTTMPASLIAAHKMAMRHDYENKFLKYDPRAHMSEMIVESFNSDSKNAKNFIKKDSRIQLKDAQIGLTTNKITGISKAIYRLTKMQQFYIGNSPITADEVCTKFYDDENSEYRSLCRGIYRGGMGQDDNSHRPGAL